MIKMQNQDVFFFCQDCDTKKLSLQPQTGNRTWCWVCHTEAFANKNEFTS